MTKSYHLPMDGCHQGLNGISINPTPTANKQNLQW